MTQRELITTEQLHALLHYSPETGEWRWIVPRKGVRKDKIAGWPQEGGRIQIIINSKRYKAHRLAWFYMTGSWPDGEIDHRDNDQSNNRWNNLREATRHQNNRNKPKTRANTSGYKGVSFHKTSGLWTAFITLNGNAKNLGYSKTKEGAYELYCDAAIKNYGEFANLG